MQELTLNRLPPLRLLVVFDTVARAGSMQSAADELNVSPPAVTQAIKALEDHIGVTLMDRNSKPARLNAAGERLAHTTRDSLAAVADVIEELRYLAGLSGRQITVSCTIGVATYWLMPRLAAFYERSEDVTVNVQAPPTDLPSLAPGTDVALRYGSGNWSDGDTVKLFDEEACPVGEPALIQSLIDDPSRLTSVPLIHVRAGLAHHWVGWPEYLAAKGLGKSTGPARVFDNYIHATQAALNGRGVMLGWRSISQGMVANGTLAALPDAAHDFGTAYYLTTARQGRNKAAIRDFTDWLVGSVA